MITKEDLKLIYELIEETNKKEDKKFNKLYEKITLLLKGIELQELMNENSDKLQKLTDKNKK